MRQIKFRITHKSEIVGYERLTEKGWEWMDLRLNPDNGERWSVGCYPDKEYSRDQSTGLQDKHGVDIYEGDILIAANGSKGQILFGEWEFEVDGYELQNWSGIGFYWEGGEPLGCPVAGKSYQIIGNIHQNPDLL